MSNDYSITEPISIIPESVEKAMIDVRASGLEWSTLVALLHYSISPDGELGMRSNGTFITSTDIAKYIQCPRGDVRRAITGLKKKGVIELSRYVVEDDVRKAVYRFVDSSITTAVSECFEEVMQDAMSERN
ncbi:MAG: hypothetical protein IKF14_18565 [Atopobiaceae bacterium]|nr:hypothetical protein [Atopobiaceae bacterium]MBR3161093.1 hypothetical protein [Atopobiaceae bacterium]